MNSIQITALQPAFSGFNVQHSRSAPYRLCVAPPPNNFVKLGLNHDGLSKYKWMKLQKSSRASGYTTIVCSFGDKGKSGSGNGINLWESFGKVMENVKKQLSVDEDKLDEQMKKLERFDDDGIRRGGGGGSGGAGGGGGNFGGADDDQGGVPDSPDEPFQVLGATIGLLFLYSCIIDYQGTIVMIKDVIKLMLGMGASSRLKQIASNIENAIEAAMPENDDEEDPYWLETAIQNTPTLWDQPKTDDWVGNYLVDRSSEYDDDENEKLTFLEPSDEALESAGIDRECIEDIKKSYLERRASRYNNDGIDKNAENESEDRRMTFSEASEYFDMNIQNKELLSLMESPEDYGIDKDLIEKMKTAYLEYSRNHGIDNNIEKENEKPETSYMEPSKHSENEDEDEYKELSSEYSEDEDEEYNEDEDETS